MAATLKKFHQDLKEGGVRLCARRASRAGRLRRQVAEPQMEPPVTTADPAPCRGGASGGAGEDELAFDRQKET